MSLAEVIKNSFDYFRRTKEAITPDLYRKVFCEEAKKLGINIADCDTVEKYLQKLEPNIKKQASKYRIRNSDELLIFLIAHLNRYSSATKGDVISMQTSLIKQLLSFIETMPIEELKNEAKYSLSRDLNHMLVLQDEKNRWQNITSTDHFSIFNKLSDLEPNKLQQLDLIIEDLKRDRFGNEELLDRTKELNSVAMELREIIESHEKEREEIVCNLEKCDEKNDVVSILKKLKTLFEKPENSIDRLEELNKKTKELQEELERVRSEANEDYITKTLNRRAINSVLENLENSKSNYTTLLLNIDKYDELLVSLGRSSGETIQLTILTVIKNSIDPNIAIGRYGGNTFIIVVEKEQIAAKLAKDIVEMMPKKRFLYESRKFSVTLSIGAASRSDFNSLEETIAHSDKMLTAAKNSGGNRVVFE